jgi:3-oxoadipate enol-lactonase
LGNAKMAILETNGAKIYYETHGAGGHWVTLINGHTRSSSDFRMMSRILVDSGIFSVLLLDNRGAGRSESEGPFSIHDMCHDVHRLWDHLGIVTSSVLGISMGGFIAQGMAISLPDRVKKLILVSTSSEESFIRQTGGAWTSEGTLLEDKMRSYFAPGFVERNPLLFSTMINQIRQAIESGKFKRNSDLQRQAIHGASWTDRLHEIRCPTLVVHGEMDQVVELKGAEILIQKISGSRKYLIPNAGHLLLAEAPKELYGVVVDFLSDS